MNWIKHTIKTIKGISSEKKKQQQFGGLIVTFLLIIFCISVYKEGWWVNQKQVLTIIGIIAFSIFLFFLPVIFFPFLFIWLFIGNILGEISSFVILGIMYYLFFTPIVFCLKLTGKKKNIKGWIDKEATIDYHKLY